LRDTLTSRAFSAVPRHSSPPPRSGRSTAAWRDIVNGVRSSEPEKLLADRCPPFVCASWQLRILDVRRGPPLSPLARQRRRSADRRGAQKRPVDRQAASRQRGYVGRVAAFRPHCIAWVALEGTRLPEFRHGSGRSLSLWPSGPSPTRNTTTDSCSSIRDELREIAAISFTDIPQDPNVVLARVDWAIVRLPARSTRHGASDVRGRYANAQCSVRAFGLSAAGTAFDIDDRQSHGWFAPDELFRERTSSQIERIGFELAAIAAGYRRADHLVVTGAD